jgi:hypothetical protein
VAFVPLQTIVQFLKGRHYHSLKPPSNKFEAMPKMLRTGGATEKKKKIEVVPVHLPCPKKDSLHFEF